VHQLEELSGGVLVQNVGELVESWGNLKTLVKDLLLALELNVVRPLDKARDITLGLDILTNTKVLGGLLDQWVGSSLGGLLTLEGIRCGGNLLASGLLGRSLMILSVIRIFSLNHSIDRSIYESIIVV
jgi:hypothetical protein